MNHTITKSHVFDQGQLKASLFHNDASTVLGQILEVLMFGRVRVKVMYSMSGPSASVGGHTG